MWGDCKFRLPDTPNTLSHVVLGCKNNTHIPLTSPPTGASWLSEAANPDEEGVEDQWDALLLTQDLENQLWLVDRARAAAASHVYVD